MGIKTYKKILTAALAAMMLMNGCGREAVKEAEQIPSGGGEIGTQAEASLETYMSETISDGVVMEAQVHNPIGLTVPVYSVSYEKFTPETAEALLIKGGTETREDGETEVVFRNEEEVLTVSNTLSYSQVWDGILYSQFTSLEEEGAQEELPFSTIEAATAHIENVFDQLGMGEMKLDSFCSINSQKLQEAEDSWKDDPEFQAMVEQKGYPYKGEWAPEDGVYVYHYIMMKNGVPIYEKYYEDSNKNEVWGNYAEAKYTKDGIIFFHAEQKMRTEEKGKAEILPPDSIAEKLKEKFDLLINTGPIQITELQLMYLTRYDENGSLELAPIWRVKTEQEKSIDMMLAEAGYDAMPEADREMMRNMLREQYGDIMTVESYIYFDAQTGKELLLN